MLEAAIRALAPRWALERAQARAALGAISAIEQRYEGGRVTRRTQGWVPADAAPEVLVSADLPLLRSRSRDLVRNNPYASAGLDILTSYEVGTGIVPQSKTGDAAADKAANALWSEWAPHADGAGRQHIYGLQAQVARSRAESGEALVMLRPMPAAEARRRNTPVPLAVHVYEGDHIDTMQAYRGVDDGVVQGVRLDRWGMPVSYMFRPDHPGQNLASFETVEIPARFMLHIFKQDRPGQVRGVPDFAPVITRLRMLDEYEDATLAKAIVQACVAAFVTSEADDSAGPMESGDTARTRRMSPGMIERLMPGEGVEFITPSGDGAFAEFARHQLRAVATGLGLTYDLITGDLSQANYASLRAGRLAFKRRLEQRQWTLFVPRLCQPIWDAFVAAAQAEGRLPLRQGAWPVEWAPPRFEMVDPLKDTMAIQQQLRLGLITWGQAVAEMGWDATQQAEEIAAWNANHDDRGIILDGDPRRTAKAGAAQDAAQNAAVEIGATGPA
jgi:lambda family phage portal protein